MDIKGKHQLVMSGYAKPSKSSRSSSLITPVWMLLTCLTASDRSMLPKVKKPDGSVLTCSRLPLRPPALSSLLIVPSGTPHPNRHKPRQLDASTVAAVAVVVAVAWAWDAE